MVKKFHGVLTVGLSFIAVAIMLILYFSLALTPIHADPMLSKIYITQDGAPPTSDDTTISAEDFTNLLNSQEVAPIDTVYVLKENITIDASKLVDTYFLSNKNFLWRTNMEGAQLEGVLL